MARLAFLGPAGTFGEEAAHRLDPDAELVPLASHSAIVAAVAAGEYERGVAAIENSLEGSVPETLDALIREPAVVIGGEIAIPIRHFLLAHQAGPLPDVRVIYSHPQAFGQCRRFLEGHYPEAQVEAALSTATAVQEMLRHTDALAIGTERAGRLYGARVLVSDIQDDSSNTTRFVLLARSDAERTGDDKTSLVFTTADRPGALVDALMEFASRGINLTKIESRPAKERLGVYVFLVDVEGHRTDSVVAEALDGLRHHTKEVRVFGSYPRFQAPGTAAR